jgi:hypothetical protein
VVSLPARTLPRRPVRCKEPAAVEQEPRAYPGGAVAERFPLLHTDDAVVSQKTPAHKVREVLDSN